MEINSRIRHIFEGFIRLLSKRKRLICRLIKLANIYKLSFLFFFFIFFTRVAWSIRFVSRPRNRDLGRQPLQEMSDKCQRLTLDGRQTRFRACSIILLIIRSNSKCHVTNLDTICHQTDGFKKGWTDPKNHFLPSTLLSSGSNFKIDTNLGADFRTDDGWKPSEIFFLPRCFSRRGENF